jgi:hypothetical protein
MDRDTKVQSMDVYIAVVGYVQYTRIEQILYTARWCSASIEVQQCPVPDD